MTDDVPAAIRCLALVGAIHCVHVRDVPLRVDHVATLEGYSLSAPGYSTLGRLWAVGCTQRLLEAAR